MYLELDNLACVCISLGQALLGGGPVPRLRVYVALTFEEKCGWRQLMSVTQNHNSTSLFV